MSVSAAMAEERMSCSPWEGESHPGHTGPSSVSSATVLLAMASGEQEGEGGRRGVGWGRVSKAGMSWWGGAGELGTQRGGEERKLGG